MRKNVCFVMPNMSGGGAQRVVSVIANELCRRDYDVSILLTNSMLIEYELDSRIRIDKTCAENNCGALGQMKEIRKKMKEIPNGVFISFLDNQNVFTVFAGLGLKNRVVVSQRNDPHKAFSDRKYMRPIEKIAYILTDAAVFQTRDAMNCYPKIANDKYSIIMNPINESLPVPYVGERTKRVVTVCRLNVQKNLFMAIDAFKMFSKNFPEYVFEIYGKGELEELLKTYAKEMDISEKVLFKGFCSDVYNDILDAAMFIISSDFEGMSNAMLEALALGIPTVATDCPIGGAKMVINSDENGILVPIGDAEAMKEAMCKIVQDQEFAQKLSVNASKIRKQLQVEAICKKWEEVIKC